MLSKHYESTEVDRRTWLHVPSGLTGPPAVRMTVGGISICVIQSVLNHQSQLELLEYDLT